MEESAIQEPKIRLSGVADVPIQFTNLMEVQHIDNEFILTFCQFTPPSQLNPSVQEGADSVIIAKPVVRLGMTPGRLLQVIQVLQQNYRKYQEGIAARQGLSE